MKIAFVMDPLIAIKPHKDSSVALMQAALKDGHHVLYILQSDLYIRDNKGRAHCIPVTQACAEGLTLAEKTDLPLSDIDVLFMRKNPPVDKSFIQTTYLLDQAVRDGVRVLNSPTSLRGYSEKLYANQFPELAPETLLSAEKEVIIDFVRATGRVVLKPLDMMGGYGIFVTDPKDPNLDVIIEMITEQGKYHLIAQRFIPEITEGDRRLIIVNGELVGEHALVRIPKEGSLRGNVAVGGHYVVQPINERDREIAAAIGPRLVKDGVFFTGIDVIGGHLIEINHTSPGFGVGGVPSEITTPIARKIIESLT